MMFTMSTRVFRSSLVALALAGACAGCSRGEAQQQSSPVPGGILRNFVDDRLS
jgi:hypothetical protein